MNHKVQCMCRKHLGATLMKSVLFKVRSTAFQMFAVRSKFLYLLISQNYSEKGKWLCTQGHAIIRTLAANLILTVLFTQI